MIFPKEIAQYYFRKIVKNAGLIAFLLISAASAGAQTFSPNSWATYYASKKKQNIKIDGDLEDWKGVKGFSLDQEKYFFVGQGISSSGWKGVTDLFGQFKVQWDEEYIYIGVEVWDDHVTPPHGSLVKDNSTGSWDDDGIEIMFDHDGCGKSRYYIGDLMHHEYHFVYDPRSPHVFDNFWIQNEKMPQPMFTLPNGQQEPLAYPGEAMAKNEITKTFAGAPYFGEYSFKATAKGYNLELKMKLQGAPMKSIDKGGHEIGFDICINDNDLGAGPLKQQLHWSGMNSMFWRDCKYFGTLILVDE